MNKIVNIDLITKRVVNELRKNSKNNKINELDQSTYYRAGRKADNNRYYDRSKIGVLSHSRQASRFYSYLSPQLKTIADRVDAEVTYLSGSEFIVIKFGNYGTISINKDSGQTLENLNSSVMEADDQTIYLMNKLTKGVKNALIKSKKSNNPVEKNVPIENTVEEPSMDKPVKGFNSFKNKFMTKKNQHESVEYDSGDYYEFNISKHYLSYLFNGDASGLEDDEYEEIKDFEQRLVDTCGGSFRIDFDEDDLENYNFGKDEVSGLLSDIITIRVHCN